MPNYPWLHANYAKKEDAETEVPTSPHRNQLISPWMLEDPHIGSSRDLGVDPVGIGFLQTDAAAGLTLAQAVATATRQLHGLAVSPVQHRVEQHAALDLGPVPGGVVVPAMGMGFAEMQTTIAHVVATTGSQMARPAGRALPILDALPSALCASSTPTLAGEAYPRGS